MKKKIQKRLNNCFIILFKIIKWYIMKGEDTSRMTIKKLAEFYGEKFTQYGNSRVERNEK